MKFIQLCGAGRSGKSTIAKMLWNIAYEHNYIPIVLPFAKALKEEAAEYGFTKEDKPEEYRKYCQKWGAGRRKEDPDYWVKKVNECVLEYMLKELELSKTNERFEHLIIQDDVRYMNEIAYGRSVDAYQIFVTTGDRDLPELMDDWRNHESEQLAFKVELGDPDYTELFHEFLVNDGDYNLLNDTVNERFITWVSSNEQSQDEVSVSYRLGLEPSIQFLQLILKEKDDEETDKSDT